MTLSGVTSKITESGGILIPPEYRQALNLNIGDSVVVILQAGELRILPRKEVYRLAKQIVQRYAGSRSLAEELMSERQRESLNE
jgi:bifunctional DNA-binding transcriptional regulator/antitoxin component of YhaV-PrlF toxin-antitoxin module